MCKKRRFDKIGAMMALANNDRRKKLAQRKERRMYFCRECNAYHLTSRVLRQNRMEVR